MNSWKLTQEQSSMSEQSAEFGLFGGSVPPIGPNASRVTINDRGMSAIDALTNADNYAKARRAYASGTNNFHRGSGRRDGRISNFNFLSNVFRKAPEVVKELPSEVLGNRAVSAYAGSELGGALGQIGGGITGMYKGATYNPDITDPETGKSKKLGLGARAALVLGGGSIGGLGGRMAGTATGALAGGVAPTKLGAHLGDTLAEARGLNLQKTTTYAHMPLASFKHGVYKQTSFGLAGASVGSTAGSALGQAVGSGVGSGIGSLYGLYKGATYNPDIVDEEGERRKLGLLARAALVTGGGAVGGMGGNLAGGLVGGIGGGLAGLGAGVVAPV